MNIDGQSGAVVEPAPDVIIAILDPHGADTTLLTIPLGGSGEYRCDGWREDDKPLTLEVREVRRKNVRPSHKPPYKYLITATDESVRVVRSMDEANAVRIYHASNESPLVVESVEIVLPPTS